MDRKIMAELTTWKDSPRRKPLLLQGARQVGKTYAIKEFARREFESVVYVDLERDERVAAEFASDLTPQRIIAALELHSGQRIVPGRTLIVLDEVQGAPRGLTALKYLCDDAPEFHVIAAGSILGVALMRKHVAYPVGKVDVLRMLPLDFEEFCWALDKRLVADAIRTSFADATPMPLHRDTLALYRAYLVCGGMPEAVRDYADSRDLMAPRRIHDQLDTTYIADMARYADPMETVRIMAVWRTMAAQLFKENRKFRYNLVTQGARASQYETPLAWLEAASLVGRCSRIETGRAPLAASLAADDFKIYLADTGLLCTRLGASPRLLLADDPSSGQFRGALAENYVMQHLVSAGLKPYYWGKNGAAEIDFVVETREGEVVPIEVKSGDNVRSRSLAIFRDRYHPRRAVRLSTRNFGSEGGVTSVPLYAAFALDML